MRLLIDGQWYEAVSSEAQYETNFEAIVHSNASLLFPDYHAIPFKTRVESDTGIKIPDFALVDKRYRYWWVVEVEMAHHPLYGHVIPQVEVFASGKYGAEHAEYIIRNSNPDTIDPMLIHEMIKGAQPRVLVIVNKNVPDWLTPIERFQGMVTVVEVFRSSMNHHVFRVNGDSPTTAGTDLVSMCRLDNTLPSLLRIDSPAALEAAHGQKVSILFNEGITEWVRTDISDNVWLTSLGRNPLRPSQDYCIIRSEDGRLQFKQA